MKKKKMEYTALGFPIILLGFPVKTVRGVEVPDVNLNKLQQTAFEVLISKPVTLSGAEVRFIRSYLRMNQTDFAKLLNQSGHSIVSQWEGKGLKATGMEPNTEIVLRLHMAKTLSRKGLMEKTEGLLGELRIRVVAKPVPIELAA